MRGWVGQTDSDENLDNGGGGLGGEHSHSPHKLNVQAVTSPSFTQNESATTLVVEIGEAHSTPDVDSTPSSPVTRSLAQRAFSFMGIVTDVPDEMPMEVVKDEDRIDHVEKIDAFRLFISFGGLSLATLGSGVPRSLLQVRFTLGAGRNAVHKEVQAGVMVDDVLLCSEIHEIHFTEGERPDDVPFMELGNHGPTGKKWLAQVLLVEVIELVHPMFEKEKYHDRSAGRTQPDGVSSSRSGTGSTTESDVGANDHSTSSTSALRETERIVAVCHVPIADLMLQENRRKDQWFVLLHPDAEVAAADEEALDATLAWMEQMQAMEASEQHQIDQGQQGAAVVVADDEKKNDPPKRRDFATLLESGTEAGHGASETLENATKGKQVKQPQAESSNSHATTAHGRALLQRRYSLERAHVEETLPSVSGQDVIRMCVSLTGSGGTFRSTVIRASQRHLLLGVFTNDRSEMVEYHKAKFVDAVQDRLHKHRKRRWTRCVVTLAGQIVLIVIAALFLCLAEYEAELEAATDYHNTLEAYDNATRRLAASGNVSAAFLANVSSLVNGDILRVDAVNLNWDFSGSLLFAFTITTAIGYGNYVPTADWAKAFTAVYALVGIYFYVYTIFKITERVIAMTKWMAGKPWTCVTQSQSTRRRFFILLTVGSLLTILAIAAISLLMFGFDFLSAFYFAVITVSTTGLGDYAPVFQAEWPSWRMVLGDVLSMVPALLGIAVFSGWMGALQYYVILSTNHGLEEVERIHTEAQKRAQQRLSMAQKKVLSRVQHAHSTSLRSQIAFLSSKSRESTEGKRSGRGGLETPSSSSSSSSSSHHHHHHHMPRVRVRSVVGPKHDGRATLPKIARLKSF